MSRRDWTTYPAGNCIGCGRDTEHMPLCLVCHQVWEHDGDTWEANDSRSTYLRQLATRWKAAYRRGEWKAVTGAEQQAREVERQMAPTEPVKDWTLP